MKQVEVKMSLDSRLWEEDELEQDEYEEAPKEIGFTIDEIKLFKKMLERIHGNTQSKSRFAEEVPDVSRKFNDYVRSEINRLSEKANEFSEASEGYFNEITKGRKKDHSPAQLGKRAKRVNAAGKRAEKYKDEIKGLESSIITVEEKSSYSQVNIASERDKLMKIIKALELEENGNKSIVYNYKQRSIENKPNEEYGFRSNKKRTYG